MQLLRYLAPISTLSAPQIGAVDGTSAFFPDGSAGVLFLFNPGPVPATARITLDESVGISNYSHDLSWTVVELYPQHGRGHALWQYGSTVTVTVAGSSARVFYFSNAHSWSGLFLVNASGQASVTEQNVLAITDAVGEAGVQTSMGVYFLSSAPASVTLNGQPVKFTWSQLDSGVLVRVQATFQGAWFPQMQSLTDPTAASRFAGPGWMNSSFTIPSRIQKQLLNRSASYPINWTSDEYSVSWLVPDRLNIWVAFKNPINTWSLNLFVNGHEVPLVPSYNSRALPEARCFLGFFADASSVIQYDVSQVFSFKVSSTIAAGEFLGLFVDNVVPEYTPAAPSS